MKKIILLLLLVLVSVTASAKKSYITVFAHPYYHSSIIYLQMTGDVPSTISGLSYNQNYHYWESGNYSVGQILNILSGYGYEVELMTGFAQANNDSRVQYLLSKEIPSNQTQSEGDLNKDGEVNISDINRLVGIILGYVREHPEVLNQVELLKP